jgi:uncharacterized repeat protein (TIGR01451 family)
MFGRLKSLTWLVFALAISCLVATRPTMARPDDIPTFPAQDAKKDEAEKPLPFPDASAAAPALPAPPVAAPLDPPAVARPQATPPKVAPKPAPEPEAVRPPQFDPEAMPAAAEPDGGLGPLGPAKVKPGSPAAPAPAEVGQPDSLLLKPEQLPAGPQTVGLSVSVVAPDVMNVGHAGTMKIVVKNNGVVDARSVRIHYDLPPEFELISTQPVHKQVPGERGLFWGPETVAAGSEWLIVMKVKATKVNTVDHAALVTLAVGSRARTVIQEPMLKVEQAVTPSRLLKGQQARFTIIVTNPGSGPARDVVVRATLSSGLKVDGEEIVEQSIPIIQAGGRIELDPLVVDTMAGGEQTCMVVALSPDVNATPDAKVTRSIVVLRPELNLAITGSETRYTDTYADYKVTVTNPGTAAAKDVTVSVTLPPNSGKLQKKPLPNGAVWNPTKQTLTWTIPKIDPKVGDKPGEATSTFSVLLGGPGMYRVMAEARAGELRAKDAFSTDVTGMVDIEMNVSERRRVLDVGESTVFYVRMKNVGSKDAKNLLVQLQFSKNLEATDTAGTDASATPDKVTGDLLFPVIESLPKGRTLELSVKVKALKPGTASCRVFLKHDDLPDPTASIEDIAHTRVTGAPAATKLR